MGSRQTTVQIIDPKGHFKSLPDVPFHRKAYESEDRGYCVAGAILPKGPRRAAG